MAKAGEAFAFRISLFDSDGALVASPTLAAGDVVVVRADNTVANIASLPAVTSAGSGVLNVSLSVAEMAGSAGQRVTVLFEDQAGDEWMPVAVDVELTTLDIDDVATAVALATVDGIVDDILEDTGTTLPATLATAAALATVDGNVDAILADTGTDGVVVAAASKTGYSLSAAGVDAILDEVVEDTYTLRQLLRLLGAALGGEVIGGGTAEITFTGLDGVTDRIVATVDANGNRSSVVLDLS